MENYSYKGANMNIRVRGKPELNVNKVRKNRRGIVMN